LYVEDLKRGTNKDMGPKDIFEMGSNHQCVQIHKKPGGNHRAFFLVLLFNFYILLDNEDEEEY